MKEDHANAIETVANRAAIDAYMVAYIKALKGLPIETLRGTAHEHVAVMNLSEGCALLCEVRINFGKTFLSPEEVKNFDMALRMVRSGIDFTKPPPRG